MTRWNDLTWPEVRDVVDRTPWALLTLGAVEEHGPHLPLGTDHYAAERLSPRLAEAADLVELPTMPYGQVWSLELFDGSLSISDATLVAFLTEVAGGLQRVGMKGLVLFSAHLGNVAAMKKATRELERTSGLPALALCYPGLGGIGSQVRESPVSHPSIMHADELETSIMLALRPDLVRMDRAVREYPEYPGYFDVAPVRWDTVCRSGVFGDATVATADKGERILAHVVRESTAIIRRWKESIA